MLNLTRYPGQEFYLIDNDDNILATIRILYVNNNGKTRIGIDAPKHIKIHRDDMVNRKE